MPGEERIMLHSAKELRGYELLATDGKIGKVHDFFLDETDWAIRYLVADTGTWLPGRRVLVSSIALHLPKPESRLLPVELTREQIKRAPSVGTNEPISYRLQIESYQFYGWPAFGGGGSISRRATESDQPSGDPHLRSSEELIDYHVEAINGEIGHLEDLFIDDEVWTVNYVTVNTRNWLAGKRVLVKSQSIQSVSWDDKKIFINLPRDTIRNAPEYDRSKQIDADFEEQVYQYYKQLSEQ
jgi:sporulation protein YlmC with PRC-barrel domain